MLIESACAIAVVLMVVVAIITQKSFMAVVYDA
jgi:hypothetical protein